MGCDIHLFGEKRIYAFHDKQKKNPTWISIDKWTVDEDFFIFPKDQFPYLSVSRENRLYTGGRNYNLFTALAGVRSSSFSNKPSIIASPRGIPQDACKEYKEEVGRWLGDGHSHSYLSLADLKAFSWSDYGSTCDSFLNEIVPSLENAKNHDSVDEDVRIVFFFDN